MAPAVKEILRQVEKTLVSFPGGTLSGEFADRTSGFLFQTETGQPKVGITVGKGGSSIYFDVDPEAKGFTPIEPE